MPLSTHLLITTTRAMAKLGSRTEKSFIKSALKPDLSPADRPLAVRLIDHCGFTSHYDPARHRSDWPIPPGMTLSEIAIFAMQYDLLHAEALAGDLFLQYSPSQKRFVHAGIILGVTNSGRFSSTASYFDLYTIEGDVDRNGSFGGGLTLKINRRLTSANGDRFLRWTALDRPKVPTVETQWDMLTARNT